MTKFEVPIWDANAIGDNAYKEAFKHKNKISKTGKIKKAKVKKTLPIKEKTLRNQINSVKKNTLSNNTNGNKSKKDSPQKKANKKKQWKLKNKNSISEQVEFSTKEKPGNINNAKKNAQSNFKNSKVKKPFNLEKNNSAQLSKNTTIKKKNLKKKLIQTQNKVNVSSSTGIINNAAVKKKKLNKIKEKIELNSQDDSSGRIINNTQIKNKKKKRNLIKEKIESNSQDTSSIEMLNNSIPKNKKKKLNKVKEKFKSNSHLNGKNKKTMSEEIIVNGNEDKKPFFEGNKKFSRNDKIKEKIRQTLSVQSSKTKWHNLPLRERMMEKLKSARFRYLNEEIYTNTSKEAVQLFKSDPSAFKAYHEGYRQQVARWPLNPLDSIIMKIKKMPKIFIVADFGCGEGRLAQSVSQKVHSFDIVAANKNIIACDMANVPLKNNSVDVVVFCLSLMGTNLIDYLFEANRVLKLGGTLIIAEVESRFDTVETFVAGVERVGFKNAWKDFSHNLFYFLDFKKMTDITNKKKLPTISLHPCLYKKR